MNGLNHERGDRVGTPAGPGIVTGWAKTAYSGWLIEVDVAGDRFVYDPADLETIQ